MIKILPYKMGSKSARDLANALGPHAVIKSFKTQPKRNNIILNWGNSRNTFQVPCRILNRQDKVATAVNKLKTFEILAANGINVPAHTADATLAKTWLERGCRVLARYNLNGHSGDGIVIMENVNDFVENTNAPLYVKYLKKKHEYRIHVFNGQVIDFVEKKARYDRPDNFNTYIRSHANGWVFCRDTALNNELAKQEAIKAVRVLGLDFGAVDIIIHKDKPYVLEINCSPALENTTLDRYKNAILNYMRY